MINGNPSKWQTMRVEPHNVTRYTIYRLEPDTLYEFKVAARNVLGSGESSTSAVVQARTKGKIDTGHIRINFVTSSDN